jgi:hypothetical protein
MHFQPISPLRLPFLLPLRDMWESMLPTCDVEAVLRICVLLLKSLAKDSPGGTAEHISCPPLRLLKARRPPLPR